MALREYLFDFLAFYLGCLGCFLLRTLFEWGPIPSASLLGVVVTFVPLSDSADKKGIQISFCTGTFVAMSSPLILGNHWHILWASLIGSGIYFLVKPYARGLGGKMGAIAFLATAVFLLLRIWA